jgi:hypothetical protein
MNSNELRHCRVETDRAKTSVMEFFEACVPTKLRPYFKGASLRHHAKIYAQVENLKKAIDNPGDVASHVLNCSYYVKESKGLIRLVSFVLLKAFPEGNPGHTHQHWE